MRKPHRPASGSSGHPGGRGPGLGQLARGPRSASADDPDARVLGGWFRAGAVGQGRRRGLWQTSLEPPWEFRSRRWTEAGSQAPGGCAIKGNINRQGELIYHTP